jgi:hypothetical protein
MKALLHFLSGGQEISLHSTSCGDCVAGVEIMNVPGVVSVSLQASDLDFVADEMENM